MQSYKKNWGLGFAAVFCFLIIYFNSDIIESYQNNKRVQRSIADVSLRVYISQGNNLFKIDGRAYDTNKISDTSSSIEISAFSKQPGWARLILFTSDNQDSQNGRFIGDVIELQTGKETFWSKAKPDKNLKSTSSSKGLSESLKELLLAQALVDFEFALCVVASSDRSFIEQLEIEGLKSINLGKGGQCF